MRRRRLAVRIGLAVLALIALIAIVVLLWNRGKQLIDGESSGWGSYLFVALLVFGDAVCPVLPGETTLSAASVLAATGHLNIWIVIVAGAVGAITGDSTVYWLARKARGRLREWMDKLSHQASATKALGALDDHGSVVLLFGRYIPGVRFALNATLGGVVKMPYARFLTWSALSGTLWSLITCSGAYFVSTILDGYPLLSLIVTVFSSTVLIALAIGVQKSVAATRRRFGGGQAVDAELADGGGPAGA